MITHFMSCPAAFTRLVQLLNGRWLDIGYEPWSCDPRYFVDDGFGNLVPYDPEEE